MKNIDKFLSHVLIVDTECTHAQPDLAEIVELGVAIYVQPDNVWQKVDQLYSCEHGMPPAASAVTGISNRMIQNHTRFGTDITQTLHMLDVTKPTWVAHNVKYDSVVIHRALTAHVPELAQVIQDQVQWLCTLRLARHTWPHAESFAQNYLRYWLDLDVPDHVGVHRAGADVITCGSLLKAICVELKAQGRLDTSQDLLPQLITLCESPIPVTVWNMGKHKGKLITDVDTDYLLWCVDNLKPLHPQDPEFDLDLYESVRQELERRLH